MSKSHMDHEHMEMANRERTCIKLEHANKKLKAELKALQQHVTENTMPISELEAYKKKLDEKVLHSYTEHMEYVM